MDYRKTITDRAINFLTSHSVFIRMTDWEKEFINQLKIKSTNQKTPLKLTDKQWNKLNEIYVKYDDYNNH